VLPEDAKVVVIDPAFLGDVVFDAPLVRALKPRTVGIVVRPPAEAIARAITGIDRVHVFDKKGRDRGVRGLLRIAEELRAEKYDAAVIPHPSLRSAIVAAAAGIHTRIGSTRSALAKLLLTSSVPERDEDTFVASRLRMIGDVSRSGLAGSLAVRATRTSGTKTRVGLALGAHWPTKRWSPAQAVRLVRTLDRARVQLVLLGAEDERRLFDEVRAGAAEEMRDAEDGIGGTVDALLERIASCDIVVGGDTGPLHIARALGKPVVAIFGPTSEQRHAFASDDRVLAIELECRPCSAHGDLVCPEGHHRCMIELPAERVGEALAAILERR
jgi:heptosyltransferase II